MMGSFDDSTEKPQAGLPLVLHTLFGKASVHPSRDAIISKYMDSICREAFPDNGGNHWRVEQVLHVDEYSYVQLRPQPSDVGSDLYVFLLYFQSDQDPPSNPAVYELESGNTYNLLSSTPGFPFSLPESLIW